ncbi:hypothetical protein ACIBO9_43400 [Streptomyces prunicolor]|uniref:hypothetical protein n=1 Tax=Streptomyces prunicolor TaxID=67348 RepID=UPI0037D84A9F
MAVARFTSGGTIRLHIKGSDATCEAKIKRVTEHLDFEALSKKKALGASPSRSSRLMEASPKSLAAGRCPAESRAMPSEATSSTGIVHLLPQRYGEGQQWLSYAGISSLL